MSISVTNLGVASNSAGGTLALTGLTVPAGSLIVVIAAEENGTGANGSVSDGTNNYSVANTASGFGAVGSGRVFFAPAAALTNGTITYTKGGPAISNTCLSAFYATGIAQSSPLDSAVTATGSGGSNAGTTTINITSGTPKQYGELFVGCYMAVNAPPTFTLDAGDGWATPPNKTNTGVTAVAGGSQVNGATSLATVAFKPTQSGGGPNYFWSAVILGFLPDAPKPNNQAMRFQPIQASETFFPPPPRFLGGRQPYDSARLPPAITAVPVNNPPFSGPARGAAHAAILQAWQPDPFIAALELPLGFHRPDVDAEFYYGFAQFTDRRGGNLTTPPETAAPSFTDRRRMAAGVPTNAFADVDPTLAIKTPVRAATTGATIVLNGLQTLDGVALASGDRVLVKDQLDPTQNGIYAAHSSNWLRAYDASDNEHFAPGMLVAVAQGTANAGATFTLGGASGLQVALGVTPLIFTSIGVNPPMALSFVLDGRSATLRNGLTRQVELPCHFTALRWSILADRAGSVTIDVWRTPYASLPLTSANSITGGAAAQLAAARYAQGLVPSSWTAGMNAGDILGLLVSNAAAVQRLTFSLYGTRP